jgi:hypothetical protein
LEFAKVEGTLKLSCCSELKTLEVSNCKANEGVLEELLGSCHSLEKFSAMNLTINLVMLRNVCKQNGRSLQFLYMGECRGFGLDLNNIGLITRNCINLTSLTLFDLKMSEEAVDNLMNFLNPNIESLSFGNGHVVKDSPFETLFKRFKNIKNIGIKSCRISNLTVTHTVNYLKGTLLALLLEAENISCEKLQDLKSMQQLSTLVCRRLKHHGARSEEIKNLREVLINVRTIHISSV